MSDRIKAGNSRWWSKRGSGKTTIATMCVMENRNVLLYGIDPQRTATLWVSRRREDRSLLD